MKLLAGLALLAVTLLLAGCAAPTTAVPPPAPVSAPTEGDTGLMEFQGSWQPQLLYLLGRPHARLYVEVAAVAGCEPRDSTLKKLREFLATYCEKPDGIEIVRRPVISRKAARGLTPHGLARQFLAGPPATAGSAPAYMPVLYYDSALATEPLSATPGRSAAPARHPPQDEHPHTDTLPYPAIYMNVRYGFAKSVPDEMLLHEAGHMLGLVSRHDFAAGHHCMDANCLMNRTLRVSLNRTFMGLHPTRQIQLCGRCMQELVNSLKLPSPRNLYYAGPVLVRTERDYAVLALPQRVKVLLGGVTAQDCQDFTAAVQAERPGPGDQELRVLCSVKTELIQDPARVTEAISQAEADPLACVRTVATRLRLKWEERRREPANTEIKGVLSTEAMKEAGVRVAPFTGVKENGGGGGS